MNRRWRQAVLLAFTLGSPAALVRAADLPASVRTSQSAGAQKSAIEAYVKSQIALIQGHGKAAGVAREELGRQPETSVVVTPSASFQSEYVTTVVGQIRPLLADKSDKGLANRLNAAIVVYRLANATKQTQLDKLAQECMDDASPAVALWGIKSGGTLLPEVLRLQLSRQKQTLTKSVVDAAKKHHTAGAVVQTAYDALYLPDPVAPQPQLPPDAFVPAIDAMNQLLAFRVQEYVTGLPPQPQAERIATAFFNRGVIVTLLDKNPVPRLRTVQNLLDVMSVAAQHTTNLPPGEARVQAITLVQNVAGVLKVRLQGDAPAAAGKFDAVSRFKDPNYPTADVLKAIGEGSAALKAQPAFKTLNDSPTLKSP